MKEKVYVETSVIGAYFDERTDVASAAQKYWTRIWWDNLSDQYEIMTSQAVVNELSHPDYPFVNVMMGLCTPILCTPNQLIGGNN